MMQHGRRPRRRFRLAGAPRPVSASTGRCRDRGGDEPLRVVMSFPCASPFSTLEVEKDAKPLGGQRDFAQRGVGTITAARGAAFEWGEAGKATSSMDPGSARRPAGQKRRHRRFRGNAEPTPTAAAPGEEGRRREQWKAGCAPLSRASAPPGLPGASSDRRVGRSRGRFRPRAGQRRLLTGRGPCGAR